ncbi:MAG: HD domain-containing protein [Pseudomonadota bacterium]
MLSDAATLLRELFPPRLQSRVLLVGGSVRDSLSGLPVSDIDLISDIPEKTLLSMHFRRVEGKTTAPILFKSDPAFGKIEITLLQKDQQLEDDLRRRDFRCNAVVMSLNGLITDPLGGVIDINQRRLSPCGPAALSHDPIRIFRAFRFAAEGWEIGAELEEMISSGNWDESLGKIPVERFTREMIKALGGTSPELFFTCMLKFEVGKCYLPELFMMSHIPAGPPAYHGTDSLLSHSLATLQRMASMSDDTIARLAAFFHDIGKLSTSPELLPRHIGHDIAGVEMARQLAIRLRLTSVQRNALMAASRLHMTGARWVQLRDATKLKLVEHARKAGIAAYLPQLVAADHGKAHEFAGWETLLQVASYPATSLGIDAAQLESMNDPDRSALIAQLRLKLFRQLALRQEI